MSAPRIPYRSPNVLPPGIPPLNLFRMWAHSPATLPHIISLGTVVFRDTSLSPYLRDLMCLLNAKRLQCEYQWKQHVQIARHSSVGEAKIAALAAGELSGDLWTVETVSSVAQESATLFSLRLASFTATRSWSKLLLCRSMSNHSCVSRVALTISRAFITLWLASLQCFESNLKTRVKKRRQTWGPDDN
jgi:hypothetical protein